MTEFSGSNRIVVDWDGTCVEDVWPAKGDWLPEENGWDARRAMREMLERGYEVVIFSTRLAPMQVDEKTPVSEMGKHAEYSYIRDMLDMADLRDVRIWLEPWKPGALAYIDDKGIRFDGDWNITLTQVVDAVGGQRQKGGRT